MHKVLWTASLSNGETVYEEKGNFQTITGELSPYQRLLAYCASQKATITSLALYTPSGKRWNLPPLGQSPKFKAFMDAEKPVSYRCYRKIGADVVDGAAANEEKYTVAEATYADGRKLQLWVDEKTENAWCLTMKE